MNENIAALKEAIRLKDSPMRVAHMRLNTRAYRPNIELVRDPVQYGLVEEVAQITDSVEALTVSKTLVVKVLYIIFISSLMLLNLASIR